MPRGREMKVLLTGASSGFGLQAVCLLLERAHTVIAGVRGGAERLVATAKDEHLPSIPEALGEGRLKVLDLHMDRPASFGEAAALVESAFGGRLDALVNNAAFGLMGPVELHSEAELRRQMEVNFFGPVLLTRTLLPFLKKAEGRVINVSSIAGLIPFPFYGAYCASKFALEAHTEALRSEVARFGVKVGLVEPGGFKTKFASNQTFGDAAADPANPYHSRIESFKENTKRKAEALGSDPMRVVRRIVDLCEADGVPLHSIIGKDAKAAALLNRLLGTKIRHAFMNKFFELFLIKP